MELKKVTKESRRIGFIILFLSVFMGFKPAIAQENANNRNRDTTQIKETTTYKNDEISDTIKKGMEGRVLIGFIVEKNGRITNVEVVESSGHPALDEEAVRVVKEMPKWKPGEQKGKTKRVRFLLPIEFKLDDDEKNED